MSSEVPSNPPSGLRPLLAEIRAVWQRFPDRTAFLCLLAGWVALFHFLGNSTLGYVNTRSIFAWWRWVMGNSEEQHAWFVPLVVLGLLWYRREELVALPKRVWWPALGLVVCAIAIHLAGYLVQQTRLSLGAFFVGLYGITSLLWGWPWLRATVFPFSLFAFFVPLGPSAEPITFPLRLLATKITGVLCQSILGINVIQDGTQIYSPTGAYQYEVAAACGGIRSLTAILAFTMVFGYVLFKANWRRLLLAASAFPLAVAGNVFRLALIIVASEAFGREAGNFVHESFFFSLAPYVPSLAGTFLLGRLLREDRAHESQPEPILLTRTEGKA